MYKVTVKTSGEYNNVVIGSRYCFTKKAVKKLVRLFLDVKYELEVEQFVYIGDGVFLWTDCLTNEKLDTWISDEIYKTFMWV